MVIDQPPYLHITDITAGNLPKVFHAIRQCPAGSTHADVRTLHSIRGLAIGLPDLEHQQRDPELQQRPRSQWRHLSPAGMGGYDPNFKMQQVEEWSLSM